tara:strand:- start:203 stop:796 length:594 start_codon:yes stop_codon:yes gene_type:complete
MTEYKRKDDYINDYISENILTYCNNIKNKLIKEQKNITLEIKEVKRNYFYDLPNDIINYIMNINDKKNKEQLLLELEEKKEDYIWSYKKGVYNLEMIERNINRNSAFYCLYATEKQEPYVRPTGLALYLEFFTENEAYEFDDPNYAVWNYITRNNFDIDLKRGKLKNNDLKMLCKTAGVNNYSKLNKRQLYSSLIKV